MLIQGSQRNVLGLNWDGFFKHSLLCFPGWWCVCVWMRGVGMGWNHQTAKMTDGSELLL